jgi:hypothetical protein
VRWLVFILSLLAVLPAFASVVPGRTDVLDIHRLPLGDGRVSDHPQAGYVFSCQQRFGNAPGAQVAGHWIHADTWDLTQKISVQGHVSWPDAQFSIRTEEAGRVISRILAGNGLPVSTATGKFPVARDDPAWRIDRNPNSIAPRSIEIILPLNPVEAAQPSCVPMGMIGIALNGVAIFNALDAGGRDAVAHEVQDLCSGHPEMRGTYHYHGPSPCLPSQAETNALIGYALDGFGIYSSYDEQGRELTNADLDACHGRVSAVEWNGARTRIYHYVLTREYPYTVGCFRGTPPAVRARPL